MKADWIFLGACAALAAYLMATDAPEPDAAEAPTSVAANLPDPAEDPVSPQNDCSANCSLDTPREEHPEVRTVSIPDDCDSAPQYLQAECASARRDRAGDPEFERSIDEPAD
jgi:hypothetical protein